MKPTTVVVSVPVTDLGRTLRFYREGLGVETSEPDDGIVLIELPNLSLFLVEGHEYASYTDRGGVKNGGVPVPGACIFSCAITSSDELDRTIEHAERAGGSVPGRAQTQDGSYIGYVKDPDGHLWELTCNAQTEVAERDSSGG